MSIQRISGYLVSVLGVVLVTVALHPFSGHVNSTTVALALLLVVLFVASFWGNRPAFVAAVVGMLCFNFFFLPPVRTLTISEPDNWIALAAFIITVATAGQLSAREKRRAEEAENGRREIERLYQELSDAFERASQAEALKRSERLKSSLLDAVTHDLRTPLTSIKASVTTLLDELRPASADTEPIGLDAEGRREMLEVIDEETDRLNFFIEDLVELARIEAGEMHLQRQREPVEEIIASALNRAAPLTCKHSIEASLEGDLLVAHVDARAVAEVIYSLVDNAAKYSPAGTTIRVSAARDGNNRVRLSVEDSGQGIPPELRERVFDKFFRAMRDRGAGTKKQPPGTGMGLAIARGIVDAHGGRIWIEDGAEGRGCRVVVELPVNDPLASGASWSNGDVAKQMAEPIHGQRTESR